MNQTGKSNRKLGIHLKEWILIPAIAVPALIIIVILFTRKPLFDWYDVSNSGTVGDAIGGITAPFINLLGAVLVYVAFKAQNRANKTQWSAIERESRVETSRQVSSLLQEISTEVESLEIAYEERSWMLQASTNTSHYFPNGTPKIGKSTLAIDYAAFLLANHKLWNHLHIDPQGKVRNYYIFDKQHLYHIHNKIRYIQISIKVVTSLIATIEDYKKDPIYLRTQAFYNSKLSLSLISYASALLKAGKDYNIESEHFMRDQEFLHIFFESDGKIDLTLHEISKGQEKYFWTVLGYK